MPSDSSRPRVRRGLLTAGLLAAFALIVIVLIAALSAGLAGVRQVYSTNEAVSHTFEVKANLEQLLARLLNAETGGRGFIITGDVSYLDPYDRARALIESDIARLRALTADNQDQQSDLDRLSTAEDRKLTELGEAIQRRRETGFAAAQAIVATNVGKHTMDAMRVIVARMAAREDALLAARRVRATQSYATALATPAVITSIALLVIAALFVGTRRLGAERLRASETAERLKVTLTCIGDAVITTDASGRVTRLNPIAQALTGWEEDEAAGRRLADVFVIVNEQTRQPVSSPVERVLREGVIVGLANHTVLLSRDGREIPIDDSAAPIRGDDGAMTGVIMVFRDISERRRAEREREALLERERLARIETERLAAAEHTARTAAEHVAVALRESEERLRITIASIGDGVIVTDDGGRVRQLNAVAESLTGWAAADALGCPLEEILVIVNDESRRPADNPVRRVLREGVVARLANHTLLLSKNGREIPIDDSAAPIHASDGRLTGVVMVFRDVSARRRAEREQAASLDRSRRLAVVAEELSQVLPLDDIAKTVLTHATAVLGASGATIRLLSDEGSYLNLLAEVGFQGAVNRRYQALPMISGSVPVVDAVRTGEPVIIESRAAWKHSYPQFTNELNTIAAAIAIPFAFERRTIGGFLLTFDDERTFSDDEQRFLLTLARLCAHAIERHRLLNAEREARREAELTASQLQTALEAGHMGAWEYTIENGAVRWSPGLEAIHGFPVGSFPGTFEAFRSEIHPADRDRVLEAITAAADQRRDHHVEYRIVRADGAVRWVEGRGQLYCDQNGQPERLVGVCLDVTDRKAAEEMQHRAREQAAFLSEASARLADSLDYEETLRTIARLAVPTVADWCAVDMVDDAGQPRRLAVDVDPAKIELARTLEARYPEDPQSPYGVYQVLRTGTPTMMTDIPEVLLVESARDPEHLRILREIGLRSYMCVPMNVAGRTLGVLTFVTESERRYSEADLRFAEQLAGRAALGITNARLYEDARRLAQDRAQVLTREQMARAELERASRLKDEFLAVLSHELRTPLNAVLGYAHLLHSGVLPPERASHALDAIQRNAHAQARLVESLLDLSRVMAGKLELNLEELNLAAIVNAAMDAIRPGAEAKGVAIEAMVPPMPIVADGGRLQQVFWNLLSNAIKFSDRGGRVAIRCTEEDAHVRVHVTDDGQGIDAEFLPYVFDRFSQADGRSRRSRTGLGLGLALVREMVQAHGGKVVAESPGEGRGSTFTVTLPLSIGSFAPGVRSTSAPHADAPASFPPIEILIVDDDGDVRDLLALLVETRGARARTVSSASEALDAISQRRPDLLLADLRMPDEDGYSLIRKVRAREREQQEERLPAIAVTAYASSRDRDQAIAAGFDSHVAKPVEPADLARAVAIVARGVSPKNEAV